ncbi:MAG: hypothetical protein U0547_11710 [Dehalococcoidia bacterium]
MSRSFTSSSVSSESTYSRQRTLTPRFVAVVRAEQRQVGRVEVHRPVAVNPPPVDLQHAVGLVGISQYGQRLGKGHHVLRVAPVQQRHAVHLSQGDRFEPAKDIVEPGPRRRCFVRAIKEHHRRWHPPASSQSGRVISPSAGMPMVGSEAESRLGMRLGCR